jgi:hypothetical protein
MAVKKPIYRYQYKPTAATYFKPALGEKEQLAKSVGTQVTNLEQRFKKTRSQICRLNRYVRSYASYWNGK